MVYSPASSRSETVFRPGQGIDLYVADSPDACLLDGRDHVTVSRANAQRQPGANSSPEPRRKNRKQYHQVEPTCTGRPNALRRIRHLPTKETHRPRRFTGHRYTPLMAVFQMLLYRPIHKSVIPNAEKPTGRVHRNVKTFITRLLAPFTGHRIGVEAVVESRDHVGPADRRV